MRKVTRDIRSDLQMRLNELEAERKNLEKRLSDMTEISSSLCLLLEHENRRWAQLSLLPEEKKTLQPAQTELSQAILKLLADNQDWQLSRLADTLSQMGFNFGEKKPGRVLHFALIGMSQHKLVEKVGNGVWRIGSKAKE